MEKELLSVCAKLKGKIKPLQLRSWERCCLLTEQLIFKQPVSMVKPFQIQMILSVDKEHVKHASCLYDVKERFGMVDQMAEIVVLLGRY